MRECGTAVHEFHEFSQASQSSEGTDPPGRARIIPDVQCNSWIKIFGLRGQPAITQQWLLIQSLNSLCNSICPPVQLLIYADCEYILSPAWITYMDYGTTKMNLWQDFLTNDQKIIHKWSHYFPIYERHFTSWRNKSITFVEIGVYKGGSLQMWQRFFGPMSKIVGIDINPACKVHESQGIFVRTGDQGDPEFLKSIIAEFGVPDIVLDDGSHRMEHIRRSFQFFYPKMHKNAIYMVEDLHTAYWEEFGGGINRPDTFINFAKDCVDRLNADHTRGKLKPDLITRQTLGISFYDSMVCFEKGDVWRKDSLMTGKEI